MPWVKLTDDWYDDKLAGANALEIAMWVVGLSWCARNLTDGHIPRSQIHKLITYGELTIDGIPVTAEQIVAGLIATNAWQSTPDGYRIVNYLRYQPSRQQVVADRAIMKRRAHMNADPNLRAALKDRDGNECRYCGSTVNWRDRKSRAGGTYDHVVPLSAGGRETVDNIVVACRACSELKGARTPDQAGMQLRPTRNQDGIKTESRHPVPVPDYQSPSSSNNSSISAPRNGDDDELWQLVAQRKLAAQTPGTVKNPTPWLAKCARNARLELNERASELQATYDVPIHRLADVLANGGQVPQDWNFHRR